MTSAPRRRRPCSAQRQCDRSAIIGLGLSREIDENFPAITRQAARVEWPFLARKGALKHGDASRDKEFESISMRKRVVHVHPVRFASPL